MLPRLIHIKYAYDYCQVKGRGLLMSWISLMYVVLNVVV